MTTTKYVYCQNCGAKNTYGNKFCFKCGHRLAYHSNDTPNNFNKTTTNKPVSINHKHLENKTPFQQLLYRGYVLWVKHLIKPLWDSFSKKTRIIIIICIIIFVLWII